MSLEEIAQFHIEFEQIHPFADGNGRIGRLLMAFQCIQNDLVPPLILNDNRREYLDSLSDVNTLAPFLEFSQNESCTLFENVI
jgi:Fic family protein